MKVLKNILIAVVFFTLGISIIAFYLPIESKSTLEAFILILQIFAVFIFHTIKSNKIFVFHSIILMAANTANLVYIFISSKQVEHLEVHQTMDMLGIVMVNAAFYIWEIMQIAIIIIIIIEFVILLVRRKLLSKKKISK